MTQERWYHNETTIAVSILVVFIFSYFLTTEGYSGTMSITSHAVRELPTASDIQQILEQTPAARDLPQGTLVLSLYDGNGDVYKHFTITDGKTVTEGFTSDYDFRLTTGDYYLEEIHTSSNMCRFLQKVKESQDYLIHRKIGIMSAWWKYRGMMKHKSCLGEQ